MSPPTGRRPGGPIGAHPYRSAVRRRGNVAGALRQGARVTRPDGGRRTETTVDVPVEATLGPGAYVAVHVFRGGAGSSSGRALGLTWVGVDPGTDDGGQYRRARQDATARALKRTGEEPSRAPGSRWRWSMKAFYGLPDFASPDPAAHYLARRQLGLDVVMTGAG